MSYVPIMATPENMRREMAMIRIINATTTKRKRRSRNQNLIDAKVAEYREHVGGCCFCLDMANKNRPMNCDKGQALAQAVLDLTGKQAQTPSA